MTEDLERAVASALLGLAAQLDGPEPVVLSYESLRGLRQMLDALEAEPHAPTSDQGLALAAGQLEAALRVEPRRRFFFYDGGYDDVTRDVGELARRAATLRLRAARGLALPGEAEGRAGHALRFGRADGEPDAAAIGDVFVDRLVIGEGVQLNLGRVAAPGAIRLCTLAVDQHVGALRADAEGLHVALRGRRETRLIVAGRVQEGPLDGWTRLEEGAAIEAGPIRVEYLGLRPPSWAAEGGAPDAPQRGARR